MFMNRVTHHLCVKVDYDDESCRCDNDQQKQQTIIVLNNYMLMILSIRVMMWMSNRARVVLTWGLGGDDIC